MSSSNEQTNDEKIKLPDWLRAELFENLLKETIEHFKAIKAFKAVPGTKPGDNYATVMLRIELEVELKDNTTKSITYMLKIPHVSEAYQDTFGKAKHSIFDIEREVFTIYVEELKQIYRDVGLQIEFGAKCYKLDIPYEHVLLEDLKPLGFQPVNRQAGLDEEHTLDVLTKLAQWHAASAVRVATMGPYPKHVSEGIFNEDGKCLISKLTDGVLPYVLKALESIEGHEAYYEDLINMEGHITENVLDVAAVDPKEFNVLNHGDFWLPNLMFLYDPTSGKLLDSYLVDYQMCKYGSVAIDLLYFLISSPKLELKVNKFDYFVKQYYDQLIKHLKLLNYTKKLPDLADIHTTLIQKGIWGYMTTFGVLAGSALEPTETASFDNLFADTPEGDAFRTLLYSGKVYKEHVKVILPWLQNRGALQSRIRNDK
ncbi:GH19357 [Drosophila grimshawi]|uniref:GH19357 n=1 Tax=Drosophila grimshawi TaxID=7222 RepID=B4JFN8_DROGR|nr:GH19357 [Drosophila grimshawi]